ncbi:MAG TPA: tRNA pseudouridine(38-40) synthase TruA [Bacteroidales bacterium]|nr:tRNA pseudouridine(38-40) synthase TruA [Bacteroidales bacterium]HPE58514.1 tRNA pseudouridine(38-40) synthase TruA [Bacteroidales bacterium]HRX97831.1 tRNA pseudouridine(38-40) synthase TruA [Bacteroidales bacterium]
MHRYFLHLAYDGTPFNGWQIQKNAPSVQETLNRALFHLCKEPINVVGCGRTDTGVHARNFYAHFDTITAIINPTLLVENLNNYLPKGILIYDLINVSQDAHARFDAISRTYKYYILREKDPFNQLYAHYYRGPLNIELMNTACEILIQHRDFTSFSKVKTDVKTFICEISEAKWTSEGNQLIFQISADRFLRNMVRAIVGTMLDIGKEKFSISDFNKIIESKNRSNAGYSVPAKGLFLENISYPSSLFPPEKQ